MKELYEHVISYFINSLKQSHNDLMHAFITSLRKLHASIAFELYLILLIFTYIMLVYNLNSWFSLIQHYIIYMGDHSHPNSESVIRANHEILASVTGRYVNRLRQVSWSYHYYMFSFSRFIFMCANISVSVMQRQQHYTIIVKAFEAFRLWLRQNKLISLQVLYSSIISF
jgi:hypothetical protein